MEAIGPPKFGRVYYGWWIIAASFAATMLVNGSTIFLFGLLVVPVSEDLHLSRAVANQGYIIYLIGMTVWGPVSGWLIDRLSARLLVPAGAIMIMVGFATIATSDQLWLIAIMLAVPVSFGAGLAGLITGSAITSRWFRRRRGRALGIFAMASSAAGVTISPISAAMIEGFGWRSALLLQGSVLCAVIVGLGILVLRDRPTPDQLKVEQPDGLNDSARTESEQRQWTLPELLVSRNFILIMIGMGIIYASDQVLLLSKVPYMQDKGVSLTAASFVVSVQSASATVGKIIVGFMSERISIIRIYAVVVAFHFCLLALYIIWPGYWVILIACSIIGIAVGGVYPVKLMLIAQAFGSGSYAFIMGLTAISTQLFSVTALYLTGLSYDQTGSYVTSFTGMMVAVAISFLLVSQVRLRANDSEPNQRVLNPH